MKKVAFLPAATVAIALLSNCNNNIPLPLRTDDTPIAMNVGGDHYVIPANYLDSGGRGKNTKNGGDGALIFVSWPEMGGRPADGAGYQHYARSNIMILIGPTGYYERILNGIEAAYQAQTKHPVGAASDIVTPPIRVGEAYGFEHFVRYHTPRERFYPDSPTHADIYVRHRPDGRKEAYMHCDGVPLPQGRFSVCDLRVAYPEFPGTSFDITFRRDQGLDDISKIERAVRAKFAEWKAVAAKADKDGASQ